LVENAVSNPKSRRSVVRRVSVAFGILLVLLLAGGALWAGLVYKSIRANLYTPPLRPAHPVRLADYRDEAVPARIAPPHADMPFRWADIATPPTSALPWTRWWWPGGAVDSGELARELKDLRAANFGGAEVQPFSLGVTEPADIARMHSFDTPSYYRTLAGMLADADRLGMRIDLTHLSGWPAGGPQVDYGDALQNLALASREFIGGRAVRVDIPKPRPTAADWATAATAGPSYFAQDRARLMSVIVARKTAGHLDWYPFNLRDQVSLDPDTTQVVTARVHNGVLTWDAPPGRWFLVASWLMPDTERPAFSAYAFPGLAADILRSDVILAHYNYAFGKRTGLSRFYGGPLRGIFNDSLEFKANRLSSADFLREFRRRRGYDLEPFLPATWSDGRDNFFTDDILQIDPVPPFRFGPQDVRIRDDYQRTLSDLVIERFVRASRLWSEARGLTSRGQTFGFDLDVIKGLGENDIPDTEQLYADGGETFLKLASSAAALYGRKLVASESFVWNFRDYTSTAGKTKVSADKLLLAGVNHIFYHGTPYGLHRGEAAPVGPQGWHPFGIPGIAFSDNFSPGAAIWADLPQLNAYIGRTQNLLRQGAPDIDVLIYYPFLGFPTAGHAGHQKGELLVGGDFLYSNPAPTASPPPNPISARVFKGLPRGEPDPRIQWLEKIRPVIDELDRRGITWGWTNGDAIRTNRLLADGRLAAGGRYGTLLVADTDSAPVEDLEAIAALFRASKRVRIFGALPERQPGFLDAVRADARAKAIGKDLANQAGRLTSVSALITDIASQAGSSIALASLTDGLRRYSRALDGGGIHFLANQSDRPATTIVMLRQGGAAWWFNPVDGTAWNAAKNGQGAISLALAPFESRILVVGIPMPHGLKAPGMVLDGANQIGQWTLAKWAVSGNGIARASGPLFDWSKDPAWRYAAGQALYAAAFTVSEMPKGTRYLLETGLVPGSAQVSVNGADAGSASLPPGRVDITAMVHPGNNRVDIRYVPSQRNGFVGKALAGDKRYLRFKAEKPGAIVSAGLLTPVVVRAVRPR
jgi:hypothetical protein